ncbi:hypothetical protein [Streptomyces sp. TLI_185]|uniref:hypothetical protein n=1 Tax=Streptomyces sp. TLI_185 TaxID=2485151 RepID=UPI000F4DE031|nr:hypothetical protein [Streptomyces sp. TLI_185]
MGFEFGMLRKGVKWPRENDAGQHGVIRMDPMRITGNAAGWDAWSQALEVPRAVCARVVLSVHDECNANYFGNSMNGSRKFRSMAISQPHGFSDQADGVGRLHGRPDGNRINQANADMTEKSSDCSGGRRGRG